MDNLKKILPELMIIAEPPMKEYTSFKVGGTAAFMVLPKNIEELKKVLMYLSHRDESFVILGAGTNTLFTDKGYRGIVVKLSGDFQRMEIEEEGIKAGAAVLMKELSQFSKEHSLTGLEFCCGIPGSIGGGAFMNAGAYDSEMRKVISFVHTVTRDGKEEKVYSNEDCGFAYRTSIFQKNKEIITGVEYALRKGNIEDISKRMEELTLLRNSKQPVSYPSGGSFFKRPEGHYAGQLIQEAGLQGLRVGGASVSTLHAGFIINEKDATFNDILNLMHLIQFTVKDKFGVDLEPEVRITGEI